MITTEMTDDRLLPLRVHCDQSPRMSVNAVDLATGIKIISRTRFFLKERRNQEALREITNSEVIKLETKSVVHDTAPSEITIYDESAYMHGEQGC